jgi:nucleoside-diphosphate-sugar epimerase
MVISDIPSVKAFGYESEAEVLAAVEEPDHGIEFIRIMFADILGRPMDFTIPRGELASAFAEGKGFDGSSVEGFVRIAESETALGEEINIATGKEISVGELAGEIIRQINPKARIVCEKRRIRPENGEVERLCGSNDKIRRLTGWQPRTSLEKGLAETIRWFGDNGNGNGRKAHLYHI